MVTLGPNGQPTGCLNRMPEMASCPLEPVGYLVMVNVPEEEWSAAITRERRIIGRSREADIRVSRQLRHVSRRHASIWADEGGQVWVEDLRSSSGTRVNDVSVQGGRAVALQPEDRLTLGMLALFMRRELSPLGKLVAETGLSLVEGDASISRSVCLPQPAERAALAKLTPAELEIVLWMTRGVYSNDDLSKQLGRSANTVRTQIGVIFGKLQVSSRAEVMTLFRRAAQARIAPTPRADHATASTPAAGGASKFRSIQ